MKNETCRERARKNENQQGKPRKAGAENLIRARQNKKDRDITRTNGTKREKAGRNKEERDTTRKSGTQRERTRHTKKERDKARKKPT